MVLSLNVAVMGLEIEELDEAADDYCCQVSGGTPTHIVSVPLMPTDYDPETDGDWDDYVDKYYDGIAPTAGIFVSESVAQNLEDGGTVLAVCDMWP